MTTAIKRRRGTTTQHSTFTGLEGEITIDTTKDTAVVHDGATAGGRPLLREDLANNTEVVTKTGTQTLTNKTLTSPVINTPTGITKSDISLGNVDNTSDATKNAATATLTNKTITLGTNTITGTVAQFQAAVTDGDFATLAGTETLTNKAFNGSLGATTPSTIAGTTITSSALTSGRVTFASTGGLLADSANLTFNGTTLSTSAISASGTNAFISNTATGTTGKYIDIANTSGRSQFGVDNSSGTTFLLSGGVAYSTTITSVGANPVIIGVNQAKVATFDTSGNLGLGVTPSAWASGFRAIDIGSGAFTGGNGSASNGAGVWYNSFYNGTNSIYKYNGNANYFEAGSAGFLWYRASSGTAGGTVTFAESMRLDSSGNLYIGTTAAFGARINSFQTASNLAAGYFINSASPTGQGVIASYTYAAASGSAIGFILGSGNGSAVTTNNLFIYTNGNVVNTNNSYGAISDIKLKENIVDASPKLDDLCKVKVRNYTLISDESKTKQLGVIAQELEEIFPSLIETQADKDIDGNDLGTTTKQVKYSVFVPMLIKAIQEQQAMIDELKAKVAALEAA